MKHLISLLAFSFLIGCDGEKSNEAKHPNLKYKIKGDAVTITRCAEGASGDFVIPTKIEGKTVTSIEEGAFYKCTSLTSITIPDGVTSIEYRAFGGCTNLTSITIPDGVTSIELFAFYECTSLTSITIPDSVTSIGDSAFADCTSLTSITIPDSVTNIGGYTFEDCTSLMSVKIGESVTSIRESAFQECSNLASITIGDGVTSIGGYAFSGCTNLTTVNFLGDAPKILKGRRTRRGGVQDSAFKESSPTIYRKADAKGWGDTFAGRPVKLITEKP